MKRLRNTIIALLILLTFGWFGLMYYLNSGKSGPDNSVWQSYLGRDTTVGILPDKYANYYTYTVAHTDGDMGFRIKGYFPDTRYFSFNVYSLGDNTTQGSLVDYQIEPDSGRPNAFVLDVDSIVVGQQYTVHIVPNRYKDRDLSNILPFRDDVKLLSIVMRLYDYNIDDFGGVPLPTVEAIRMKEGQKSDSIYPRSLPRGLNLRTIVRNVSLPKMVNRLSLLYKTEREVALDASQGDIAQHSIPFHAIDTRGFIENNDNRYLLAGVTKHEDEVYLFKLKSPSYSTGVDDINRTEVRYWSFNLGNAASYNYNAIKDEDALVDDQGYVHILLADKDSLLEKRAKDLGYNFLEWNMSSTKALILFRHMLANPDFEAQIESVPPITDRMTQFEESEAQRYMGDYAPQGLRMSKRDFLEQYRSLDD